MAFSFKINDQWGLLNLVFWGELAGAETDEALLSVVGDMSLPERRKIIRIGIDWRKVNAASLQDTDGARVKNSTKRFKELLGFSSAEWDTHFKNLKQATLIDPFAPVAEVLVERLNRVSGQYHNQLVNLQRANQIDEFDLPGICTTQKQFLQALDLPPNFSTI